MKQNQIMPKLTLVDKCVLKANGKINLSFQQIRNIPVKDLLLLHTKLNELDYDTFLKTNYWITISRYVRKLYPNCNRCQSKENLHVHHKTYINHGIEALHLEDLQVLCNSCHSKVHYELKIKKKLKREKKDKKRKNKIPIISLAEMQLETPKYKPRLINPDDIKTPTEINIQKILNEKRIIQGNIIKLQ